MKMEPVVGRKWPMWVAAFGVISALVGAPGAARADLLYDVSIDDGAGNSVTATFDAVGVTPTSGYIYDTADAWTITITAATGSLSNAAGLVLTDPYGSSYLDFSNGQVVSAYLYYFQDPNNFINFYSAGPGAYETTYEDYSPSYHYVAGDATFAQVQPPATVPEPSSLLLLGSLVTPAVLMRRRRARRMACSRS